MVGKLLIASVFLALLSLSGHSVAAEVSPACQERAFDVEKIARAKIAEFPSEQLHGIVSNSPELSPERAARINEMIDEAYGYKGKLIDWAEAKMKGCVEI